MTANVFCDTEFDQAVAGNCLFLDCSLAGVPLSGCNPRKCRFTDTAMRDVRIVSTDLAASGRQDPALTGCALAGATAGRGGQAMARTAWAKASLRSR